MRKFLAALGLALAISLPATSFAGDGATIIFRSGIRAYVNKGYSKILDAMKTMGNSDSRHAIVQLDIEGAPFLLNVAEVVILCRDDCTSLEVVDTRDPARSKGVGRKP